MTTIHLAQGMHSLKRYYSFTNLNNLQTGGGEGCYLIKAIEEL
jgi:hypothetical protein